MEPDGLATPTVVPSTPKPTVIHVVVQAHASSPLIPEWLANALAVSVITVVLTALFVIRWDTHKANKEREERDRAVLRAVLEEIGANIVTIAFNKKTVDDEMAAGETAVIPLTPLSSEYGSLLVAQLPRKLTKDAELLTDIQAVMRVTASANELMRRREGLIQQRHAFGHTKMEQDLYRAQWKEYSLAINTVMEPLREQLNKIKDRLDIS
jgi:hypothetical protein